MMNRIFGIMYVSILKIFRGSEFISCKYNIKKARKQGIKVGENCRFYSMNFGSEPYLISIGNHVTLTSDVKFSTHDGGVWVFRDDSNNIDVFGKIEIGNNVFVGMNTIFLPGVKINDNTVIGAGSIVTKSFPENVVIAGNPAKVICSLDEYREKMKKFNAKTKGLSYNQKKNTLIYSDCKFIRK